MLTLPGPGATVGRPDVGSDSLMQLASFEDGSRMEIRAQNSPMMRGSWDGWVSGYGVGGNVQGKAGIAGIDYAGGGTQFGIYRFLNRRTLMGVWGAYGHQNIDSFTTATANINSGSMGVFFRRDHDCCCYSALLGDYTVLAMMGGYDSYHTSRVTATGIARGNFDGAQAGAYFEKGWNRCYQGRVFQPSVALQYIRVHQDDFQETGAGANNLTVAPADTDSLRTKIGARVQGERRTKWGTFQPEFRAHWQHELLDTTTATNISTGGAAVQGQSLDMGRDVAIIGTGITFNRGGRSFYGNYDLQFNSRQSLNTGSAGVQFNW